jgi:hypothetical protein
VLISVAEVLLPTFTTWGWPVIKSRNLSLVMSLVSRCECYRQVTLAFLGTETMVVCLKHVGITDWVRERLKMSVKTLVNLSADVLSMRPGNPSGLTHIGYKSVITQSSRTAGVLMHGSVLHASKRT